MRARRIDNHRIFVPLDLAVSARVLVHHAHGLRVALQLRLLAHAVDARPRGLALRFGHGIEQCADLRMDLRLHH